MIIHLTEITHLNVDKCDVILSLLLGACRDVLGEVSCEMGCEIDILAIAWKKKPFVRAARKRNRIVGYVPVWQRARV